MVFPTSQDDSKSMYHCRHYVWNYEAAESDEADEADDETRWNIQDVDEEEWGSEGGHFRASALSMYPGDVMLLMNSTRLRH